MRDLTASYFPHCCQPGFANHELCLGGCRGLLRGLSASVLMSLQSLLHTRQLESSVLAVLKQVMPLLCSNPSVASPSLRVNPKSFLWPLDPMEYILCPASLPLWSHGLLFSPHAHCFSHTGLLAISQTYQVYQVRSHPRAFAFALPSALASHSSPDILMAPFFISFYSFPKSSYACGNLCTSYLNFHLTNSSSALSLLCFSPKPFALSNIIGTFLIYLVFIAFPTQIPSKRAKVAFTSMLCPQNLNQCVACSKSSINRCQTK